VGKPAWSKELISLGFKWRAWAGRRQKRTERREKERKKGGNKTELDIIHLVIIKFELFPEYFVHGHFCVISQRQLFTSYKSNGKFVLCIVGRRQDDKSS
jgi:hypothetical protein